ncbi:dihydrofolate reductase family protein [Streptomyces sp. NBC_01619]|uniref:Dihydrofolate reductase family protein n=1 Tax=Streptomyces pratisoli TaxID=3139917 RepID=A0ACC6QRA2_9ACTN|nr:MULTISPECIES: dihydrofolate reductase family protein [unclassified Streptomyces]MCX4514674.1 dihydrofolate reductase family protein [Streptomyces sp. NBC_01619]
MAQLTLTQFITLDGVYQAPGGPNEDTRGGFTHGGWSYPYADDDFSAFMTGVFDRVGGFLLGRRTYDIFAGAWPRVTDENDPIAFRLNSLPKYVVSTTLEKAEWNNSTIVSGNVAEEVARLKQRTEGELQIHGSGALARSLMAHDLIDEFHLLVYPVVLGAGMRLFADGAPPTRFELAASSTTSTGVAIHTYRTAGRPEYGAFELAE